MVKNCRKGLTDHERTVIYFSLDSSKEREGKLDAALLAWQRYEDNENQLSTQADDANKSLAAMGRIPNDPNEIVVQLSDCKVQCEE